MNLDAKTYQKYAGQFGGKSKLLPNCIKAFFVGGLICCIGEGLYRLYLAFGILEETVKTMVPCTLIIVAAILTGAGLFDVIAKHAGAGTLVPITGFANAVVAPAIDTKAEGYILGVGAKLFTIAGPVIVYGTIASVLYGIVYVIFLK